MPTTLDFTAHGEGIGNAAAVLRNNAAAAGLTAAVPTCPGWTVADLVTHQGLVHRWATAIVEGRQPREEAEVLTEAAGTPDLLEWLDDGMVDLLNALAGAPEDLDVWFFLPDAPAPRQAWARRQCHETTIHAVDAMAARLGRPPRPDEVWFTRELARDGIDELLHGFATRSRYAYRPERAGRLLIAPDDVEAAWSVTVGPDGTTTAPGADAPADVRLTGPAAGLYLGLWNRGNPFTVSGDRDVLAGFSDRLRVSWN